MARDKNVAVKITLKDKASKGLKGFLKSLFSIKGLLAAGIGLVTLNKLLAATVGRAQSAESGLKRLSVAMKTAGRFTDESAKSFERLSVTIERETGFIEEDVLQALAVLQTFGSMSRDDMNKTIRAATNMATVFNEDLTSSAIRLGKAYNGNLRGLQMMGVGIDAAAIKAKGFQAVLDQLGREQGGQAVARMAGFEGSVLRVGVAWGEVGKELGKFITKNRIIRGSLDTVGETLQDVAGWLRDKREADDDGTEAVIAHTKAINDQEAAMKGLIEVGDSILLQDKIRAKQLQIEIEQTLKQVKNAKFKGQEKAFLVVLIKKEQELEIIKKRILIMDKDINVIGSKAHQQALAALKVKEQDAIVEENNKKKVAAAKDKKIKATIKEIELTQFFHEILEEEADISKENKDAALAAAVEKVKAIIDSDARLSEIEKSSLERALDAEVEKVKAVMDSTERIEAIEQASADKRTAIQLDAAQIEFDGRQKLADRLAATETARLRNTLTDETLNWADRKEAIAETEEKAEEFLTTLQSGSITSAVELEKVAKNADKLVTALEGTEGTKDALATLKEVFAELATQSEVLGRAIPAPQFDAQAIINSSKTMAQLAFSTYKEEIERLGQINRITVPSVTLRSSFMEHDS